MNINFGCNPMGGEWPMRRKPWVLYFYHSAIRKRMSGYWNYLRIVWWRWDVTFEWGTKP